MAATVKAFALIAVCSLIMIALQQAGFVRDRSAEARRRPSPALDRLIHEHERRADAIEGCIESGEALYRLTTEVQDALVGRGDLSRRYVPDPLGCPQIDAFRGGSPFLGATIDRYVATRRALARAIRELYDAADARDPHLDARVRRFVEAADAEWSVDAAVRDLHSKERSVILAIVEEHIASDPSRAADVRILRVIEATFGAQIALRHVAAGRAETRERLSTVPRKCRGGSARRKVGGGSWP